MIKQKVKRKAHKRLLSWNRESENERAKASARVSAPTLGNTPRYFLSQTNARVCTYELECTSAHVRGRVPLSSDVQNREKDTRFFL